MCDCNCYKKESDHTYITFFIFFWRFYMIFMFVYINRKKKVVSE